MKHYTNKKTNEVFGYESIEDAQTFNDDFENLVEMTEEQFIDFKDNRPAGGKWTVKGWAVDKKLLKEEQEKEKQFKIEQLQSDKSSLMQEMQMHMLLGDNDKAKEFALKVKEIELKIKELD